MEAKPINFSPNQIDQDAMDALKENHPNLLTTADVLRYCIHMTHSLEDGSERPVVIRTPEEIEALRLRLEGYKHKA